MVVVVVLLWQGKQRRSKEDSAWGEVPSDVNAFLGAWLFLVLETLPAIIKEFRERNAEGGGVSARTDRGLACFW